MKLNNSSIPLDRMKDALKIALQSRDHQSQESLAIVIDQKQLEPIISLIKTSN